MSRVLLVLGPAAGGMRGHVETLARALPAHGWDPVIAAQPAARLGGIELAGSFSPGPGLARDRARLRAAARDVDLVHAHGMRIGWLCATLRRRPPLIVTAHTVVLSANPVSRVLERLLAQRVDRMIATSDEVARRLGAGRIVTIPPARPPVRALHDRTEVRARYGIAAEAPLVLGVGRLHPQKDFATLLDAVALLAPRIPGMRALIVGDGPDAAALRAHAERAGLSETVVFGGWSQNAADEMAAADVVAVSSRWESGPFVVPEALSLGTPVVSTTVGWAPAVLDASHLVAPGDARALAAALATALTDAGAARAAAAGEDARARALLDPAKLVADVVAVYEEVRAR